MKTATADLFQKLNQSDWFGSVGKPDFQGAKPVSSWMQAVVKCAGYEWEMVQSDAVYFHKLAIHDAIRGLSEEQRRQRDLEAIREELVQDPYAGGGRYLPINFPQWDQVWAELKPQVRVLVEARTKVVVTKERLPEVVLKSARWDILFMAVETEFAEVQPPGFFTGLLPFYLGGHFPCGWEGHWPEGQLLVY